MVKRAEQFMRRTKKNTVTQTDLLEHLSKLTKYDTESVRGTVIGGGIKLFGRSSFKSRWLVCDRNKEAGRPKRFVRRGTEDLHDVVAEIEYDTPNKKAARERGLKYLKQRQTGTQKIITLAAAKGHCVRHILEICPNAEITNIERETDVLSEFKKTRLRANNFAGSLSQFIQSDEFSRSRYRLANIDLMGPASPTKDRDFRRMNALANVEIITITLQGIKNFRNQPGKWKIHAMDVYGSVEDTERDPELDPTRNWIVDIMNNYRLIDEWFYVREPEKGSRAMRVFVLERRR